MQWNWCWVVVLVLSPLPRCEALPQERGDKDQRGNVLAPSEDNDSPHEDIRKLEKEIEKLWDAVHYLEDEVNHHLHREHDDDWHDMVLEETRQLQHEERVHHFDEDHPEHADHHDDELFQHLETVHRGHRLQNSGNYYDRDGSDDDDNDLQEDDDSDEQRDKNADSHEHLFDAHDQHHVHHPHFDRIHGDLPTHELASHRMKYPGVVARAEHKHKHEDKPHKHGHGHGHGHGRGRGYGRGKSLGRGGGRMHKHTSKDFSRESPAGRGRAGGRSRPREDHDTWHDIHHQHLHHDDYHPDNLLDDETLLKAYCKMTPNSELPDSRVQGVVIITQRITPEGEDKAPVFFDMHLEGFNVSDHGSHQSGGHLHGFHLHEKPVENECSKAKSHYNPEGVTHSSPFSTSKHAGDLGNIACNNKGELEGYVVSYNHISLEGPESIIGRSIVIHEGRDDLGLGGDAESLKTGNAGKRLACCTIGTDVPASVLAFRIRMKG